MNRLGGREMRRTTKGRRAAAPARERQIPGVWSLQGQVFWEAPVLLLSFWASGRPNLPSPLVEEGGRCFGTPLCAISRFRQQDAQTPPSPRVGEGGRGDEGQKRAGMQQTAHRAQERCP